MPQILWIALVCLALTWLISRCVTWMILWIVKKKTKLNIKIGSFGFLSLKKIKIQETAAISLEIDSLWLSCSLVNKKIRKPLGLCALDIRIQTDVAEIQKNTAVRARKDASTMTVQKISQHISSAVMALQYIGIHVNNIHIILLNAVFRQCLVHTVLQEVNLLCGLDPHSIHCKLELNGASCQVIQKVSQEQPSQSRIAELSLNKTVTLQLKRGDTLIPEFLKLVVHDPSLTLFEDLLSKIKESKSTDGVQTEQQNQMQTESTEGSQSSATPLIHLIPKIMCVKISETALTLASNVSERTLKCGWKLMKIEVDNKALSQQDVIGSLSLALEGVQASLPKTEIGYLNKLHCHIEVSEERIHLKSGVLSGFIHYYQQELDYWAGKINAITANTSHPAIHQTQPERKPEGKNKIVSFIKNKTIHCEAEVKDMQATVTMSGCDSIKAGLVETNLTMNLSPNSHSDEGFLPTWQEADVLLFISTAYCHLDDPRITLVELNTKQHIWNCIFYLAQVEIKLQKSSGHTDVSYKMDGMQGEWSPKICASITRMMQDLVTRIPRKDSLHREMLQTGTHVGQVTAGPVASHSQGGEKPHLFGVTLNFECSNVNIFTCCDPLACAMFRLDKVSGQCVEGVLHCTSTGAKLSQLRQSGKSYQLLNSTEVDNYIGHIKSISMALKTNEKELDLRVHEEVYAVWNTRIHMTFLQTVQEIMEVGAVFTCADKKAREGHPEPAEQVKSSKTQFTLLLTVRANTVLGALLSNQHKIIFSAPEVVGRVQLPEVLMQLDVCSVAFDHHDIFKLRGAVISFLPKSEALEIERTDLELKTNRVLDISFNNFSVIFPNKFNFAACFEEVVNMVKWLKLIHKKTKRPFTIDSPLPPDVRLSTKNLTIQVSDDPFEVKLGDNYDLLCDEYNESRKREAALDRKIAELKRQYGLLPSGKVEELYSNLKKKNAEIYIQRSRLLYQEPLRTKLFTWTMQDLEIIALADRSLHGKENVVKHLQEIDHDSPYPAEGLEFITLWCRMVNTSVKSWTIHLRDFPQPCLDVVDLTVWGKLIGAEQEGAIRAKRTGTVQVGSPWGDMTVERSMPPLKFYHDFCADAKTFTMAYGACWEPVIAQTNRALDLINKPSLDPSIPMPFWDKIRLLLHGRLTMCAEQMSWLYHASLDPHNTTEFMDWTWNKMGLEWTNAKWVLKGDLDITARTASKYDDCRLLHLPNLRYVIKLEWLCLGNPNDHHAVMPCAPDKVPEFSLEEHDSYRAFRSQKLNMTMSFKTTHDAGVVTESPSCIFFASTLRWMDKIKMILASVSRPIRRGPLYDAVLKPKKLQFTRHFQNFCISMNLHKFHVCYWMSSAKQHGFEMEGGYFDLNSGFNLQLQPVEDGLIHRPQANWSIQSQTVTLQDAKVWLCSASAGEELNVSLIGQPVKKSYFLSVTSVSYGRDNCANIKAHTEEGEQDSPEKQKFTHRVQIVDMKGAWSKSNRNTVFGLFDAYQKAQALRRNLSSEALKGFKVENSPTPLKTRAMSMTAGTPGGGTAQPGTQVTPSPLSRIQSGHAHSMLEKLVQESDSKFTVYTDEFSQSAGGQVDKLHGIAACKSKDVISNNWFIELQNSQMMIKGCETLGYVIVSAAKAQIWSCLHQPIWKDGELKSKTTWVGGIDCMQYYATVDPGAEATDDDVFWVSREHIEIEEKVDSEGTPEMVGSGLSVGGVVSSHVGSTGEVDVSEGVQLQRIISRCKCQFFYASYGEVDPNSVAEVPLPSSDDSDDMLETKEGVDAFTLLHHDLNICTNPLQYAMILDIVNNLLLYVDPKKKEAGERLKRMRFKLQLASDEDQRTPILQLQETVRMVVLRLRRLERELYMLQRTPDEAWEEDRDFDEDQMQSIERQINECKDQLITANEELTIMISCFTQSQLQDVSQLKSSKAQEAVVVRHNEVCFMHAQWRLTETDGQLGMADLVLRNFIYHKVNNSDDSGAHLLELGYVKVTNLLPNSIYRDVLVPQCLSGKNEGGQQRQVTLRIFCREKGPVGGIPVKEHFEINVVPITLQLTYQFFKTMMGFFFPGKNIDSEEHQGDESKPEGTTVTSPQRKRASVKRSQSVTQPNHDVVEKMTERAEKNNMFLYIKIPEVPLRVSYKGEKEKNIEDVHDFGLTLPTLEYHNQTWTWLDLLMAMKNDSKRVLLSQAIKQKLHMRSRVAALVDEAPVTDVQQEEDKAKMLLGAKLLAGNEKPSSKKNLFGKSSK
ncbi:protein KIAA0100 [Lingula anatina]|uniref:Protein KIAA0100 n=1 Tax=Lingula anatina TaxID=7574 RepID=A0A1S3K1X6_LINAN|nr:protein KIAA0100 [Lingula anatina]|eukprot:XP_013416630.1 protein KIAA0100 [Lingula anatina]